MKKEITRVILSRLVAVFVSGAVLTPVLTPAFAAEQMTDQDHQMPMAPSTDGSQDGNDDQAAHHHHHQGADQDQ